LQQRNTDIQAALTVIGRRAEGPGAVDLTKANIQGAHLDDAHLSGANLSRAYLREANLSGAHLGDATLSVANLRRTNLSGVYVGRANLSGANLSRAYLREANLSDVKNLTQAQLDLACGMGAKLPDGLTLKPCSEEILVAPALNRSGTP
jgi:uncharacterized protein YjbI with pentapeptide repeats